VGGRSNPPQVILSPTEITMPRLSLQVLLGIVFASLLALPACTKKAPEGGGDEPAPTAVSGSGGGLRHPPTTDSSHHFFFVQLNATAIRDSALFMDVKRAFSQNGATALWDKFEGESNSRLGFSVFDVVSVTACLTEVPVTEPLKFVIIVTFSKPINKADVFGYRLPAAPDARGLYSADKRFLTAPPGSQRPREAVESFVHFPDDNTAVVLHEDNAQKYLEGYAKDRTTWPMNAELARAAAGHTLFLTLKGLPRQWTGGRDMGDFAVTMTADLKGKQLDVAGRVTFPDPAGAEKGRDSLQKTIGSAVGLVEGILSGKQLDPSDLTALPALKPVFREAHRALKDATIEVSGSDVTLAGSYQADFDIAKLVGEGVKQFQDSAPRVAAQNNLKQIGIGLINHADLNGANVPIYGVGPNGSMQFPSAPPKESSPTPAPKGKGPPQTFDPPLLSWRVAILPYIDQLNLYKEFNLFEPWDSEQNKKLIDKMPRLFAPVARPGKPGYTHMQMVVGPSAMRRSHIKYPASISDGTANTIAVVEAAEPVIWTKPDDVMFPAPDLPKDFRKKFGGQFPGGFHVLLWDSTVRFIPDTMSDRTLMLALNPNDGQAMPEEWEPTKPDKK
jgi:hypothetical protein